MTISFIYPLLLWLLLLLPLTIGLALLGPPRPTVRRFWSGLVLRAILLTMIILAVAGIQTRLPAETLTVVFLLDVSESIPTAQQDRGVTFISAAIQNMNEGDLQKNRAAVVMFGKDALVERLASPDRTLPGFASVPISSRSDLAGALQLGLALFPDEGAKRMVLLSDGRENLGTALDQADLLAAHQIELVYVPLQGPQGDVEVLVETLEAPTELRQGQFGELIAVLNSTAVVDAVLRVFDGTQIVYEESVTLQPGQNRFRVPVEPAEVGFRRFRAQVIPALDTRLQNNEANAFTVVTGPPNVMLVEGLPGDGDNLAAALEAGGMQVTMLAPEAMPVTLPNLAVYDAIILANVSAAQLPAALMETLPVYVRDLGRGLVMLGGTLGYGAGGYLRTPIEDILPVYMDVQSREQTDKLALVLAIDKSGSMGRCHCDDPDLRQEYVRQEVGQPKVDIAKAAVLSAASALGRQDFLGVVAFDDHASWAYELSQTGDFVGLERAIGGIMADGQTNIRAGVEAAFSALQEIAAKRKHVILLTDGWSYSGDISALIDEMTEAGITFSIVAAGSGSAEFLEDLAERGAGNYYPAADILRVPEFFLKETVKAVGEYIIEEPFFPLPVLPGPALRGVDVELLPPLLGYNGTTPKNTARIDLVTARGDPLLATWQYGLGRSAAWTSDLKGQWGLAWVEWSEFSRFANQLVGYVLPSPRLEGVTAEALIQDDRALISVQVLDPTGLPLNFLNASAVLIGPDLATRETVLPQVGAGKYEASLSLDKTGTYLVRVGITGRDGEPLGQQTLGLVLPYSPEYRTGGTDRALLSELARRTGGEELLDASAAFIHNLPSVNLAREIWRPLLIIVALLFPLDVAIRRVRFGQEEILSIRLRLLKLLPARLAPARSEAVGKLFQARERARQSRTGAEKRPAGPTPPSITQLPPHPISSENEQQSADEKTSGTAGTNEADTLARLRLAKRRAQRDDFTEEDNSDQ